MVEQDIALADWLKPFVEKLGHKKRRHICPVYISGLIGPDDRKSIEPMAERLAPDHYDRLHHFISDGIWDASPLETELAVQADRIVGASDAFLVSTIRVYRRRAIIRSGSLRNMLRCWANAPIARRWYR